MLENLQENNALDRDTWYADVHAVLNGITTLPFNHTTFATVATDLDDYGNWIF